MMKKLIKVTMMSYSSLQNQTDTLQKVHHCIFHHKKITNQQTAMDFTQHIIQYYQTEARHGLVTSFITGIVLTVASLFLWRFSNASSILKGVSVMVLLGGLVFSLGGFFDGHIAKKALPEKVQQYQTDRKAFLEKEVPKVERIHKAWTKIRIFWSALVALGLILFFVTTTSFWTGIAIGSLIVGTIGHIEETISYQHNEKYRKEVLQEKAENHF